MRCPVCDSRAKDITPSGYRGLSVRCIVDGDYDIDRQCHEALLSLDPSGRHTVLNAAILTVAPGSRPRITAATFVRCRLEIRSAHRTPPYADATKWPTRSLGEANDRNR
ncbi:hypothetical protein K32_21380 [Kaistia sp. 32K]|uniref:hypothetical protein n=1 Tax=Kaistia sp. 32K TaxID=2795690 RepID=UPI0019163503|nr:hypothetical protein [Kaistia sp. 32K]BCP53521.1 hypothetical protein K32_21380 [Kaistia sp. 32K]